MRFVSWIICSFMVSVILVLAGCGGDEYQNVEEGPEVVDAPHDDHEHEHESGPHDGHLVELGDEEYHAEVVFDAVSKTVTVYLLGSDAKTVQPISIEGSDLKLNMVIDGNPTQLEMSAKPDEGDPEGESSRFELAGNEEIAEHVKDEEDLEGRLSVTIDGKPYSGEIEHHHDHDDDHDDHDDDHK